MLCNGLQNLFAFVFDTTLVERIDNDDNWANEVDFIQRADDELLQLLPQRVGIHLAVRPNCMEELLPESTIEKSELISNIPKESGYTTIAKTLIETETSSKKSHFEVTRGDCVGDCRFS